MDIGKQISALRTRRGVTQEAMARQLGVSPQAVSKWEREFHQVKEIKPTTHALSSGGQSRLQHPVIYLGHA